MNEAYRTDGVVTDVGNIQAAGLPFQEGDRVELVVWRRAEPGGSAGSTREEIDRRLAGLKEMAAWFEANRPQNSSKIPDEALRRENLYGDDER